MKRKVKLSKKCRRSLHRKPNVVGVGMGFKEKKGKRTGEQAVVVFVAKKMPRSELAYDALVPHTLNGQPVDVVEIGEVRFLEEEEKEKPDEDDSPKAHIHASASNRLKHCRPAPAGVSIGHYKISAGTLGAVVKDRATGERLILSNNHVLANSSAGDDGRAEPGDAVLQPGAYDGGKLSDDLLGHLERFIPMQQTFQHSQCSTARLCEDIINRLLSLVRPHYRVTLQRANEAGNLVDAALARPLEESAVSAVILELGEVSGTAGIGLGERVVFSGRTSGVVRGTVIANEVSLFVTMEHGRQVYFYDQMITSAVSRPGDSGSLLMNENNQAVGLLFAGSDRVSVGNRIEHVCRLLDIQIP